jgi:hypothetical protein
MRLFRLRGRNLRSQRIPPIAGAVFCPRSLILFSALSRSRHDGLALWRHQQTDANASLTRWMLRKARRYRRQHQPSAFHPWIKAAGMILFHRRNECSLCNLWMVSPPAAAAIAFRAAADHLLVNRINLA